MIFVTSTVADGNMSIFCGDSDQAIKNKNNFLKRLKIDPKNIAELHQMHGSKIIKLGRGVPSKIIEADGFITNNPTLFLMIKAADCHQIGFYDPTHQAIALIHAGYRGLEKNIIKKAVADLVKNYSTNPKDLIVNFGPSIGPCCYRIDIWQQAEDQLVALGILKKNINNPKICTYESSDFFSHREAEDKHMADFRFATILGL